MTMTKLVAHLTAPQPTGPGLRRRRTGGGLDPITALTRRLDLATYRAILADPWWNLIRQAIVDTRAYDRGLDAGLQLLRHTDTYRDVLDPRVIESHIRTLCLFVLEMLDKRDEWEWYLATWDLMRAHTSCGLTYAHTARLTHGPRLTPFILGEDARGLHVHYLYLIAYRKAVVERKRDRQRRGGKLGNCWHGRQEALSDAEIHERLGRVAQLVREAARQR